MRATTMGAEIVMALGILGAAQSVPRSEMKGLFSY